MIICVFLNQARLLFLYFLKQQNLLMNSMLNFTMDEEGENLFSFLFFAVTLKLLNDFKRIETF